MLAIDMVRAGALWHRHRVAVQFGAHRVTYGEVDALSPIGKILRRELRDPLWEGTERPGRAR